MGSIIEYSAKIPALTLLVSLGWNFLSPAQALASREHKTSNVVLKNILREELKKRHFHYAGKDYPLSEKAIDTLLSEVCNPALNEGLGVANERIILHELCHLAEHNHSEHFYRLMAQVMPKWRVVKKELDDRAAVFL